MWISIIAALIGAAVGTAFTAAFFYLNTEIQKKKKREDLYRLLKAEILNLRRHCSVTHREIDSYGPTDIAPIRTLKYKDGSTLLLDTKELYLLNENICQDVMQISLMSRNNDIYIDDLLQFLQSSEGNFETFARKISKIRYRISRLDEICGAVLDNLDKFFQNPDRYNEPVIDW